MTQEEFVVHACEQVLRFTKAKNWDDLSEEFKVQLGFNMGAMALGLNLTKEESFLALSNARQGNISMQKFQGHLEALISSYKIEVDEAKVARPF
ncbi:MAG: hypothetical protein GY793_08285 [Proteobacteria bacterium]|nr:hypothetical protein [Pseudomonadota bacterium]